MEARTIRYLTPDNIEKKAQYTPAAAAAALGVSPITIYRWGWNGWLKKVKGTNRFTGQALLDALKARDQHAWQDSQRKSKRLKTKIANEAD